MRVERRAGVRHVLNEHSGLTRPLHAEVENAIPDQAKWYRQAAAILGESPSASAVLSRRVLADLLEKYAGRDEFNLEARIDEFNKDPAHPSALRDNRHYLREIGNLGAHTQEDDQANLLDVEYEEAEWTLDIVDRLLDYFIVGPARDEEMRTKMDGKFSAAGRKPLRVRPTKAPAGQRTPHRPKK
jgi:hypothetical protein